MADVLVPGDDARRIVAPHYSENSPRKDDADTHYAALNQLRHEYDILLREKREMEEYCEEIDRDRVEKEAAFAGLRSDRDDLQKQIREANSHKQRILELETELDTQCNTVAILRKQQRDNQHGSITRTHASSLNNWNNSNDSGCGDSIQGGDSLLHDTNDKSLFQSRVSAYSSASTPEEIKEEIARVEHTLDELVTHLRHNYDALNKSTTEDDDRAGEDENHDTATGGDRGSSSAQVQFGSILGDSDLIIGGEGASYHLRSELRMMLSEAQSQTKELAEELNATREKSRQWEAVTNSLEVDLETTSNELKYEREMRMQLQDQVDELVGMLQCGGSGGNLASPRSTSAMSPIKRKLSHQDSAIESPLFDHGTSLADELSGNGGTSLADELSGGGDIKTSLADELCGDNGGSCAMSSLADELADPTSALSDAEPVSSAQATAKKTKPKSLLVPDNLKELIYENQIDGATSPIKVNDLIARSASVTSTSSNSDQDGDGMPTVMQHLQSTPVAAKAGDSLTTAVHRVDGASPIPTVDDDASLSTYGSATVVHTFQSHDPEVELSVCKGEVVAVVKGGIENEWWIVQNQSGLRGYVPRNYLDPTDDAILQKQVRTLRKGAIMERASASAARKHRNRASCSTLNTGESCGSSISVARFDYVSTKPKELCLTKGESLTILSADPNKQWWQARNADGAVGFVPVTYLAPANNVSKSPGRPSRQPPSMPHTEYHHNHGTPTTALNRTVDSQSSPGKRDSPMSESMGSATGNRLQSLRIAAAGVGGWLRRKNAAATTTAAMSSLQTQPQPQMPLPSHQTTTAATPTPTTGPSVSSREYKTRTDSTISHGSRPVSSADNGMTPSSKATASTNSWWNKGWSSVEKGVGKTKQRFIQKWNTSNTTTTTNTNPNNADSNSNNKNSQHINHGQENVPPSPQRASAQLSDAGPSWMAMAMAQAEKRNRSKANSTISPLKKTIPRKSSSASYGI